MVEGGEGAWESEDSVNNTYEEKLSGEREAYTKKQAKVIIMATVTREILTEIHFLFSLQSE